MGQTSEKQASNVLRLPDRGQSGQQRESDQRVGKVRLQLSLLQGYGDLLQGLSTAQQAQVFSVLAEKTRQLNELLAPFLAAEKASRPAIDSYREARKRSRQLVADYRTLLDRLHEIVESSPRSSA